MTLFELMVAIAVGGILLTAVLSLSVYSGRSLAGLANYVALNSDSRIALDRMTREIRQSGSLTGYQTNRLAFIDFDGQPLVYEYQPAERVLIRTKMDQKEILLEDCDNVKFEIFKRNPIKGSYDHALATNAVSSKVISMSVTCSRTVLGVKMTTEGIQTAKVVIRKS
jgi:hypothetical protein